MISLLFRTFRESGSELFIELKLLCYVQLLEAKLLLQKVFAPHDPSQRGNFGLLHRYVKHVHEVIQVSGHGQIRNQIEDQFFLEVVRALDQIF